MKKAVTENQPDTSLPGTVPGESDTATRILDAALALYLEFGLRRTTMDDVARQAGIGRVTVYRHYVDKHALFQAVVLRECYRAIRDIEVRLSGMADMEDRVVEGFVQVVSGARQHPLMRRLLDTEPEWLLPHLTVKGQALLEFGRGHIARYLRYASAGRLEADRVEVLAEVFMRLLNSLMLMPESTLAPADEAGLRASARKYFLPLFKQ